MKKSLIITSTLLIMAMITTSAFAWGPGRGRGNNQDCPRYGQQADLDNLSEEQKNELSTLRQKFIDDTYETRSAKLQKREELKMLMETSAPDKENLNALTQQISDLQKQLMDKRIDFALEAKKISPELNISQGRGGWKNRGKQRYDSSQRGQGCSRYNN